MVHIEPRSAWGARHPNGDRNLSGLADEVFLHHTVTAHLSPNASVEQERTQMRVIERIGQSRFGSGISYNVLVFPSGRAYEGVSFNRRGTHTGGRNSTARSVCFVGNYETTEPTAAAVATAAAIIAEGRGKWWRPSAPVRGHREIKSTSCPGQHVYALRAYLASGGASPVGNPVPAPAPSRSPEDVWNAGFSVAHIKAIQEKLNRLGYRLAVDGIRGPKTQTAVKSFQAKHGLAVDGHPGPATTAKIDALLAPKPAPAPAPAPSGGDLRLGSTGPRVRALQVRLNRDFPAYSKLALDGSYGPATQAVVREFQRRAGLKVDGIAGPATHRALGLTY